MVANTISTVSEILTEIYKLVSLVKDISAKVDCLYPIDPDEEDEIYFDEDEVVAMSDTESDDEMDVYNTCLQYHSVDEDGPA